ncbi:unnamed protein product [Penicillium roqueforti FM164]|uniref:Genomic scaffold, ProqFM164S01 n=1 Tax=Penicillium roqueforti (strain FM164) TaxID=1365484 RepID=W6QFP4_PENRF|nr:unnamed protein product [Penicillium roqueforti FM164]
MSARWTSDLCDDDSENAKFKAILSKEGPLRLCGFGEARIGPGPYDYLAMPCLCHIARRR